MSSTAKCPKCGKAVYFAEQQLWNRSSWHKNCFKCTICSKTLVSGSICEHENKPYCQSCYNKNIKPKGYGFGVTNLASHTYTAPSTTTTSAKTEEKKTAKFCGDCGTARTKDTDKFCSKCGKKFD
eukprot:TRINITY_DN86_c1_g1_i1.p1 TRINITY_DN86_c1_g1~~TRINITY_DN86_c1_g1_i1.p1  ORF type:complete len:125 (-),score=20.79 TRINITY_DN86_c1_g1_i1:190-564(-)